ncbi:MAG TPA: serine hydrolase domain-containing protein [Vicinamibacterales bacterium]|nr:serine hydrolase domain-containing protein [Vicinamibacterales bacterium]
MTPPDIEAVATLLSEAVAARVTPGAVVQVGTAAAPRWTLAAGHVTYAAGAGLVTPVTVYDLGSLTKVLATTALAMRHAAVGTLPLETALADRFPQCAGQPRVTVADLLEHAAGLPAHRPFYREVAGRSGYLARIAHEPPTYAPRSAHEYTDLGFILLGLLVEQAGGMSLAAQFDAFVADALGPAEVAFGVREGWRGRVAPTAVSAWRGRMLVGRVHDDNAAALGGAAGHAGLFGTASAVGGFARWYLTLWQRSVIVSAGVTAAQAARFATRGMVPGSSRALGWDTMLPTSSCGRLLSPRAIGHTGFTGTSLWIDPDRDLYIVMLTNRVHAGGDANGDGIRALRIALHTAVASEWR